MYDLVSLVPRKLMRRVMATGALLFFGQVLFFSYLAFLTFEHPNEDSSYLGELLWHVYRTVPTAAPMMLIVSAGQVVFTLAFMAYVQSPEGRVSGKEYLHWARKHWYYVVADVIALPTPFLLLPISLPIPHAVQIVMFMFFGYAVGRRLAAFIHWFGNLDDEK